MKENVSENSRKHCRFSRIKDMVRKVEALIEVLIFTAMYYLCWRLHYNDFAYPNFESRGKYVFCAIYILLVVVLFVLCDSFMFGRLKLTDVLVSQWIAIFMVNFISYLQICLIANSMVPTLMILLLTAADFAVSFVCVTLFTYIYHRYMSPHNMLLIYGSEDAVDLKIKMDTRRDHYNVSGLIDVNTVDFDTICEEILKYDAVIVNDVSAESRNDILKFCYDRNIRTYLVPKISDIITRGAESISLFDTPVMLIKGGELTPAQRFVKRTMDIVLCSIAMIPCLPVMLIVAAAIKLEDGGPVFFRQKRVTIGGREFEILKFRSMIVDAEKGGYNLSMRANGADPRITKVGRIIRACRIDELPQLLNILKGDMSIVGPRPERYENVEEYSKLIPEFNFRHKVKGGLTGYAQIYGKYNTSAYDKIRLDLMYIENYSLMLDIKLIFMTLQILVRPESTEGFDAAEERRKLKEELLKNSSRKDG